MSALPEGQWRMYDHRSSRMGPHGFQCVCGRILPLIGGRVRRCPECGRRYLVQRVYTVELDAASGRAGP